jgi:hypothetical protein
MDISQQSTIIVPSDRLTPSATSFSTQEASLSNPSVISKSVIKYLIPPDPHFGPDKVLPTCCSMGVKQIL